MPYSLLHISALRNDINAATDYLEGGAPDTIHVWEDQDKRLATVDAIEVDVRDDQVCTNSSSSRTPSLHLIPSPQLDPSDLLPMILLPRAGLLSCALQHMDTSRCASFSSTLART